MATTNHNYLTKFSLRICRKSRSVSLLRLSNSMVYQLIEGYEKYYELAQPFEDVNNGLFLRGKIIKTITIKNIK